MSRKLSVQMFVLLAVVGLYMAYFHSRYVIAANSAVSNCLQASYFLVDTWDKDVSVNDLAAFVMNIENPVYPVGRKWIKQVVAVDGMTVNVSESSVKFSDGREIKNSMTHTMSFLHLEVSDIKPVVTLTEGQLFMMGDTQTSYDSRYWGPVTQQDILGKAYALF